jgi:hypothetical protein
MGVCFWIEQEAMPEEPEMPQGLGFFDFETTWVMVLQYPLRPGSHLPQKG